MKHYIYIRDNIAYEIIPEINEAFPEIPIEDRYTKEFLSHCVVIGNDEELPALNDLYLDGKFISPKSANESHE